MASFIILCIYKMKNRLFSYLLPLFEYHKLFWKSNLSQTTSNRISGVEMARLISSKSVVWQQFGIIPFDEEYLDCIDCKSSYAAIRYCSRQ